MVEVEEDVDVVDEDVDVDMVIEEDGIGKNRVLFFIKSS